MRGHSFTDCTTHFTHFTTHLGGGRMRGQSMLRKMFLQPLRMLQCQHTHSTRTGKVFVKQGTLAKKKKLASKASARDKVRRACEPYYVKK